MCARVRFLGEFDLLQSAESAVWRRLNAREIRPELGPFDVDVRTESRPYAAYEAPMFFDTHPETLGNLKKKKKTCTASPSKLEAGHVCNGYHMSFVPRDVVV